jgi:hypothetical protein
MSNTDKAIKVNTSGRLQNGEYVKLSLSDRYVEMQLPGMPTALEYMSPEGLNFGFSLYYEYAKVHDQMLADISQKYGSEVMNAARKKMSNFMIENIGNDTEIDKEIKEEITEIIEHLTTLLKAKLLEYVHAKHDNEVQRMEANMKKAKQMLQQVMKDGPEALK